MSYEVYKMAYVKEKNAIVDKRSGKEYYFDDNGVAVIDGQQYYINKEGRVRPKVYRFRQPEVSKAIDERILHWHSKFLTTKEITEHINEEFKDYLDSPMHPATVYGRIQRMVRRAGKTMPKRARASKQRAINNIENVSNTLMKKFDEKTRQIEKLDSQINEILQREDLTAATLHDLKRLSKQQFLKDILELSKEIRASRDQEARFYGNYEPDKLQISDSISSETLNNEQGRLDSIRQRFFKDKKKEETDEKE